MNQHTEIRKLFIGPRGGRKWELISTRTNGLTNIIRPGTYKVTQVTNGWYGEPQVYEITEEELQEGNEYFDYGVLI